MKNIFITGKRKEQTVKTLGVSHAYNNSMISKSVTSGCTHKRTISSWLNTECE